MRETERTLLGNKKKPSDIRWIGTMGVRFETTDLKTIFDIEYYDGFGAQEINPDLLVVGDDWWLERHEYDGSEWWEFKTMPKMPEMVDKIPIHIDETEEGYWD